VTPSRRARLERLAAEAAAGHPGVLAVVDCVVMAGASSYDVALRLRTAAVELPALAEGVRLAVARRAAAEGLDGEVGDVDVSVVELELGDAA
jgi:hypothetical protein